MSNLPAPMDRRHGLASLDSDVEAETAQQCQATNWVNREQCRKMTRHLCGNCMRRTCGVHAHNHKGDWRSSECR